MTAAPPSAVLTAPRTPLAQRAFDVVLWGGIILMLLVSFGPVEITKLPLLLTNSDNSGAPPSP